MYKKVVYFSGKARVKPQNERFENSHSETIKYAFALE